MKKVVVGIISNTVKVKQYLLMSSTNDCGAYTGFYYPPGGHLDNNEDKITALIREIREELSIDVIPLKEIAETDGDVANQITYWWLCKPIDDSLLFVFDKQEIKDIIWMTKDQILDSENVWPATKKFFKKYL